MVKSCDEDCSDEMTQEAGCEISSKMMTVFDVENQKCVQQYYVMT